MFCSIKLYHILYMEKYNNVIKNNEFKTTAPTWNGTFDLSDRLYSVSDIEDLFVYIIQKTWRKN